MIAPEWRGPVPNFMRGRDGTLIDRIVMHHMDGSAPSADAHFHNPGSQVSSHFGVTLGGLAWQWVSEGDTAFHAGVWPMNLRSIGIEHEDHGQDKGVGPSPYTDDLYAASALLVKDVCSRLGIPLDREHIIGHKEVIGTACPGTLDIDRIVRQARGEEDMTPEQVRAIVLDVLAKEYGPALEAELVQRLADNITATLRAASDKLAV